MANPNAKQHQNTASQAFYRVFIGLESDSIESWGSIAETTMSQVWPTEVKQDGVEGEIYKISTGDRSHPTFLFHGPLKTADAKVTITLPASKDNDYFRNKMCNEWDSRTDMRRWFMVVLHYDEQDKQKVIGRKWMSGMPTKLFTALEAKGASGDAMTEEFEFQFERAEDLNTMLGAGYNGEYDDITDNPLNRLDTTPNIPHYSAYISYVDIDEAASNSTSSSVDAGA